MDVDRPAVPASDDTASPLRMRRGRVVFRARRPAALVLPFGAVTEAAGVAMVVAGIPIGWFVLAAPVVAMAFTGVLLRPSVELTREGLVQRQYPFATITLWDVVDHFGITRAGNRVVLAYRLKPGIPPPRRQPAAALLRAAQRPFDGGYFADSMRSRPEDVLATVVRYLADPVLRSGLPPATGVRSPTAPPRATPGSPS